MSQNDGRLEEQSLGAVTETLAVPGPGPAAGAAAAAAAALAAGLGEKVAHSAGEGDTQRELSVLRSSALALADEDTAAFAAFLTERTPAAREAIVDVPVRIAETAARIRALIVSLDPQVPEALHADARATALLAGATARCIAAVLEANLDDHSDARLTRVHQLVDRATDATDGSGRTHRGS